jgi:hypothetical protein
MMGKSWEQRQEEKREENRQIRKGRNQKLTAREKRKEQQALERAWGKKHG